jgi:hypothetical protein
LGINHDSFPPIFKQNWGLRKELLSFPDTERVFPWVSSGDKKAIWEV